MSEENLKKIQDFVYEFFQKAGLVNFEIRLQESVADDLVMIDILMDDASLFIGEQGRNLEDLDRLLKLFLKKKIPDLARIHFDINNYQKSREEVIRDLAKQAARKVRQNKTPLILSPMKASERRVVHSELSHHPDIKTESIGEGKDRRVVVKYLD